MISFNLAKKSKPLLGIDISSSSIKMVELAIQNEIIMLKSFDVMPLADGIVIEKNIADADAAGQAIASAISRMGAKTKDASVCIPSASVITKIIGVTAALKEEQLESQIEIEADQHIPFPLEEVALDYSLLGTSDAAEGTNEVLLIAGRKEPIDSIIDTLDASGLTPKVIDYEPYAQQRALAKVLDFNDVDDDAVAVFADIGANSLDFIVVQEGTILYSREQSFGGKELIDDLAANFDLSQDDALRFLGGAAMLPDGAEGSVLAPFRAQVVRQLTRSLQLFFAATNFNDVDVVVLSGGVAAMEGLQAVVQKDLDTRTLVANPLDFLDTSEVNDQAKLARNAPALMLAIGLALWGHRHA